MKILLAILALLPFTAQADANGLDGAFRVGNAFIMCRTYTGVTIQTTDREKNLAAVTWGLTRKEKYMNLNPGFFGWTWITLGDKGQMNIAGTQIFLVGNAPAGREVVLHGFMGTVIGVPGLGGMAYPVGFVPQAPITCSVTWDNTLGQ